LLLDSALSTSYVVVNCLYEQDEDFGPVVCLLVLYSTCK